ncbi:hypothetical protein SLA2020_263680 [Shorea laevis]
MLASRTRKGVFRFSEMIAKLNHIVLFSPVVYDQPITKQNPSFISVKVRCFRTSGLTNDTKSFSFTDAEHISKNSPHFLQNLLSKIDGEKDVARSLTKFLRYNPINEFEPFFESLGLSPSELPMLLPRHLMFLSDDCVMLENFHVLCDYGIPRSKIGKMYTETTEVFKYDHGMLALKLQAYETLGLSRPTVVKLVSCCPSVLIGGVNSEFVKVLERLKRLGFEVNWIGGYLSGKAPTTGTECLILWIFLIKWAINPQILAGKCVKNLLLAMNFLLDIGMGSEDIASIISAHIQLLGSHTLKGPKTVCKDLKVGRDGLCKIIKEDPMKLFDLASKAKIKSTEQASSEYRKEINYRRGLIAWCKLVWRSTGAANIVKQAPMVLNQSKDMIEKKIDCLRNYLGYPLESVVAFPAYLCYDMERIRQRFSMYVWLRERGAAKPTLSLSTLLACSDARFERYFVNVHPEGPAMWESIKNHPSSS